MVCSSDDGVDLLREEVGVLQESQARLEHAHALHELGLLLRRTGHPRDARAPLREAVDLAVRCGARALADAAGQELTAAGARPLRTAVTGLDALTAAERRVAMAAADGRTNTEIAQALFVTRKTVEKHLGAAHDKLQISSRAELTAALKPPRG